MTTRYVVVALVLGSAACSSNAVIAPYDFGDAAVAPSLDAGPPEDSAADVADSAIADAPLDTKSDAPVISYGLCDPSATWKSGVLLAASSPQDDSLGSITGDELTMAWTSGTEGSSSVHYADRASTTASFGSAQTAAGSFAFDRAALSPDGLRLTVINADRKGFSEMTRATRAAPFGAASAGPYAGLNDFGANTMPVAEIFADPLLAPNDRRLYFSRYGGGRTDTIFASNRLFEGDAWDQGVSLAGPSELVAVGATRKRPTGVSADLRAFFFWDETASTERVAWYVPTTYAFEKVIDLGAHAMAQPNAQCDRLYYSAAGAATNDLFSADRN